MPIQPVKIPQNVYVEDRIIGPVTLRQLIITGIGAGIGYLFFAIASKAGVTSIIILVVCWTPAVIAAMFAFMRLNDLSLFQIILLMIEGFNKPSTRTWVPHSGIVINIVTRASIEQETAATQRVAQGTARLSEMTRQLNQREVALRSLSAVNQQPVTNEATDSVPETEGPADTGSSLPVTQGRVRVAGLDPHYSIDGIMPSGELIELNRIPVSAL